MYITCIKGSLLYSTLLLLPIKWIVKVMIGIQQNCKTHKNSGSNKQCMETISGTKTLSYVFMKLWLDHSYVMEVKHGQ